MTHSTLPNVVFVDRCSLFICFTSFTFCVFACYNSKITNGAWNLYAFVFFLFQE